MTKSGLLFSAFLVLLSAPVAAQTAEPSATTATYGNWTVTCGEAVVAGSEAPQKVCQMTTKLNLKGNDGQVRPLLEIAIGLPPGGDALRIVLQVPIDVALREALVVSVDAQTSGAEPRPQTDLVTASYFACTPAGCIADAVVKAAVMEALKAAKTTNVTFTALAAAKKITVPVEMTGFVDALTALGLPAP